MYVNITSIPGANVHEDMNIYIQKINGQYIKIEDCVGYFCKQQNPILGWLSPPKDIDTLKTIIDYLFKKIKRSKIVTFIPADFLQGMALFNIERNGHFVYAIHDLDMVTLENPVPCIRKKNENLSNLSATLELSNDLKIELRNELEIYYEMPNSSVICIKNKEDKEVGIIIVHGAYNNLAWIRRLFVTKEYRDFVTAENLLKAALADAKKNNFNCASGLIPLKDWRIGTHKKLKFNKVRDYVLTTIFTG